MLAPIRRTAFYSAVAALGVVGIQAHADDLEGHGEGIDVRHVLLLSIDGMHALDFQNCAAAGTCPNLAALAGQGVTYTRASASMPSDSFPGLMALVSGGTPRTVGAYYDVAYDRVLAPPQNTTAGAIMPKAKNMLRVPSSTLRPLTNIAIKLTRRASNRSN